MVTKIDININCPLCGEKLDIVDVPNYDEWGDILGSDTEWECPNKCEFDDEQIEEIDEKIDDLILKGDVNYGINVQ